MSLVRAFLAVPLTAPLRETLEAFQAHLKSGIPDVRWNRPENLHLTLHFFGDIAQENLEKIKVSMLSVKRCHRPFMTEIIGLGAFPEVHRARVLWLGLNPAEQLRQLHRDCRASLLHAGIACDSKPFVPHLTIGRARRRAVDLTNIIATLDTVPSWPLRVDRLVLYESRLHPGGADHRPIFSVDLEENATVS